MNKNSNDDAPLFENENRTAKDSLQQELIKQDVKRINKLINIGSRFIGWFILVAILFVLLDFVYQKFGVNNDLLKEAFSLIKYSMTTVLGFVFANYQNRQ